MLHLVKSSLPAITTVYSVLGLASPISLRIAKNGFMRRQGNGHVFTSPRFVSLSRHGYRFRRWTLLSCQNGGSWILYLMTIFAPTSTSFFQSSILFCFEILSTRPMRTRTFPASTASAPRLMCLLLLLWPAFVFRPTKLHHMSMLRTTQRERKSCSLSVLRTQALPLYKRFCLWYVLVLLR